MSWRCRDCKNEFIQPPLCVTCGAQKLYDATVTTQAATIEKLRGLLRNYIYAGPVIGDKGDMESTWTNRAHAEEWLLAVREAVKEG